MKQHLLAVAIATAMVALAPNPAGAKDKEAAKGPHSLRGSVELQQRSNSDISLAPSSSDGFDFASFGDFAEEGEDAEGDGDEDEEDDDEDADDDADGGLDDIDLAFDEDELEEIGPVDEDGDGIDDLIDEDDDARADSIQRTTLAFGLGHKYRFTGAPVVWGSTLKVVGDFHRDRGDLDKTNWLVGTGPEFTFPDKRFKLKTTVSYLSLEQNDRKFLSTLVGSIGLDFQATRTLGFDLAYNYQDKDVVNPDSPDAIVDTLTLGVEWKASRNDVLKVKYAPKVEDSSQVTRNKDTSGWQFTYSRKLPWEVILGLGVKRNTVDYENLTPFRSDDILSYSANLEKKFSDAWFATLAFEKRERDSNIDAKDGENRSVMAELAWKF